MHTSQNDIKLQIIRKNFFKTVILSHFIISNDWKRNLCLDWMTAVGFKTLPYCMGLRQRQGGVFRSYSSCSVYEWI